jgi:hypothetical protein
MPISLRNRRDGGKIVLPCRPKFPRRDKSFFQGHSTSSLERKHGTRQGHYASLPRSTEPAARTTPTFLNQKRSTLVREESQFGWSSIQRLQFQRSPGPPSRGHNPNLGLSRGWANLLRRAPATVAGLSLKAAIEVRFDNFDDRAQLG